jgi:hypothetical protein
LPAGAPPARVEQAASICARYADVPPDGVVKIQALSAGSASVLSAAPYPRQECEGLRIGRKT